MPSSLNPQGLTSYTNEASGQLQINAYGPLGAGKTTFAASVSEFFPGVLPTKRAAKCAKLVDLSDIIFLAFDKDPAIGLSERGLKAEQFLVRRFMARESEWKKAKFHEAPDFIQACEIALEVAAEATLKRGKKWIIMDTASHYDIDMCGYYSQEGNKPVNKADKYDTRAMYGLIAEAQRQFYQTLTTLPAGLIVLAHVKAYSDQMTSDQKRAKISLTAAGMPDLVPAITGKSALIWKIDAIAEFFLKASMVNNKLERFAYAADTTAETKNRLELSIPTKNPAHLRKILKEAGLV
jgi:hypothetical protein